MTGAPDATGPDAVHQWLERCQDWVEADPGRCLDDARLAVPLPAEWTPADRDRAHSALCRRVANLARVDRLLQPTDEMRLEPGALVADRYRIERELGRGGFGRVLQARQLDLGRTVALKIPLQPSTLTDSDRNRLAREAQAVGRLTHPAVVALHDCVADADPPVLVFEFVDGDPVDRLLRTMREGEPHALAEAIHQPKTDPVAAACDVMTTVLDALGHAHDHGVIHGDVKPGNLMIDSAGRVRVLDFGLAHGEGLAALSLSGAALLGTPSFLAPELLSGEVRSSVRSDVYSAGATLVELLTLEPPFGNHRIEVVLDRLRRGAPLDLHRRYPKLPSDLLAVAQRAMAFDPAERYGSVREFAADLLRFRAGQPTLARPIGPVGRLWRAVRRHRLRTAMVAALVMTSATAAGIAWHASSTETEATRVHRSETRSELETIETAAVAGDWAAMASAMQRATTLVAHDRSDAASRNQLDALSQRCRAARALHELRQNAGLADPATTLRSYRAAFERIGVVLSKDADRNAIVANLRTDPLRSHWLAGIDSWIDLLERHARTDAAALIDSLRWLGNHLDETAFGSAVRDARIDRDAARLVKLDRPEVVRELSAPLFGALVDGLEATGAKARATRLRRLGPVLYPQDFHAHLRLGRSLLNSGSAVDHEVAIQCLRSALTIRPGDASVLGDLATLLVTSGQAQLGRETAEQAIAADPNHPVGYFAMAGWHAHELDLPSAIEVLRKASQLDTTDAALSHANLLLGNLLLSSGQLEAADHALHRAIEHDPDLTNARVLLAQLARQRNDDEAERRILLEAHRLAPEHAEVCVALARREARQRDLPAAFTWWTKAFALPRRPATRTEHIAEKLEAASIALRCLKATPPTGQSTSMPYLNRAQEWVDRACRDALQLAVHRPPLAAETLECVRGWSRSAPFARRRDQPVGERLRATVAALELFGEGSAERGDDGSK